MKQDNTARWIIGIIFGMLVVLPALSLLAVAPAWMLGIIGGLAVLGWAWHSNRSAS